MAPPRAPCLPLLLLALALLVAVATAAAAAPGEASLRLRREARNYRRGRRPKVKAGSYSEELAFEMVDFAAAAYFCRSSACETWACSACREHPMSNVSRLYDRDHNGNGFVGHEAALDVVVVSFAGTDTRSMKNWIDDLDGVLTPYVADPDCHKCKVHQGFLQTYGALQPQVLALVQEYTARHPGSPIWVTGHSLGAALGVLCTLDLLSRGYDVEAFVNFGQPRAGNHELANYIKVTLGKAGVALFRLVHAHDPVPHLPPSSFGFHHPPTEVWYSEAQTSYVICNDSGEDRHCSDQYYIDTSVSDHLHYLGVEFGAAELEGRLAEIKMMMMAAGGEGAGQEASEAVLVDVEAEGQEGEEGAVMLIAAAEKK